MYVHHTFQVKFMNLRMNRGINYIFYRNQLKYLPLPHFKILIFTSEEIFCSIFSSPQLSILQSWLPTKPPLSSLPAL